MKDTELILTIVMWTSSIIGLFFALYLNVTAIKLRKKSREKTQYIRTFHSGSILHLNESFNEISKIDYEITAKKKKVIVHSNFEGNLQLDSQYYECEV